jgi:tetratricopeptide (TPR) repeat protein
MAEDLRRYGNRFVILARRAGPVAKAVKWVKRRPGLAAALALIALCATAAGGLAYRVYLGEQQRQADEAQHQMALLEEKRHSALDKAMLAAHQEDFEAARDAIHEAEDLGCSPGQVRMLWGKLKLCEGQATEAIDHLEQAVKLLQDSVAAWSMLAAAHGQVGRLNEYQRALSEAKRLSGVSSDDFLFLGFAESILDPEGSLRTLERAARQRSSVLLRLVRAEVLYASMLNSPDQERATEAMKDVAALNRQLPGNAMVLRVSLNVHHAAYHVFGEFKEPARRQQALEQGRKDASALERFAADSSPAIVSRWEFARAVGEEHTAFADLGRIADTTNNENAVGQYAQELYRHRDFEKAVKILERHKGTTVPNLLRVIALAELLPDGPRRANQLCDDMLKRDLTGWDLFNTQLVLRFLGRRPEATVVSRKFLEKPAGFPPVRQDPFRRALEYCADKSSGDDLVRALRVNRGDLCNAHLCIALTALADGRRPEARKHFQLCLDTNFVPFLPYEVSRQLLTRMEQDAAWPPWVPGQK